MKKYALILLSLVVIFVDRSFYSMQSPIAGKFSMYEYFPTNTNVKLVYDTPFGENIASYTVNGDQITFNSESDDFKYRQKLLVNSSGVYVLETSQRMKIFLFLKKEETYTYSKPLLRYPIPFTKEWEWNGIENYDGDTASISVTGKFLGEEEIATTAGKFKTIKVETNIISSSGTKNKITEWLSPGIGMVKMNVEIEGGGLMGTIRDVTGYGTINFNLKELREH